MQAFIRFISCCALALVGLSGCKQLEGIDYSPKITPETFLQHQHWLSIHIGDHSFIWSQPTSTLIVYFVGLFSMYAKYMLLVLGQVTARLKVEKCAIAPFNGVWKKH